MIGTIASDKALTALTSSLTSFAKLYYFNSAAGVCYIGSLPTSAEFNSGKLPAGRWKGQEKNI